MNTTELLMRHTECQKGTKNIENSFVEIHQISRYFSITLVYQVFEVFCSSIRDVILAALLSFSNISSLSGRLLVWDLHVPEWSFGLDDIGVALFKQSNSSCCSHKSMEPNRKEGIILWVEQKI